MKKSLISVVMPAKNAVAFINECVDSIIFQTYKNWELLVVDDGSEDETYEVLKKYNNIDERIKIFKNEKDGIIDALQLAYSKSKGELITRMDADDIMHKDKLKYMLEKLQEYGSGSVALGQVKYFCDGEIGEGFARYEAWLNKLIASGNSFSEIYKECVIPSPCWMIHRDDFDKAGAFDSSIYPEDYDLAFRFREKSYRCIPSNKVLHYWRDYETRTSRNHPHYADNSFIEIKINYFLKNDYKKSKDLVVWGAGKKGKKVAELLIKRAIPFYWICDNPKKIGREIYSQKLLAFNKLDEIKDSQSIITVANLKAQQEIKSYFNKRGKKPTEDYVFFC